MGDRMELLLYPKTEFVARFMGSNFFTGSVVNVNGDGLREINVNGARVLTVDGAQGEVPVSFLPSDVTLSLMEPVGSSLNVFRGVVEDIVHLGERIRVSVRSQVPIVAEITQRSFSALGLGEGQTVYASFKATAVRTGSEGQ